MSHEAVGHTDRSRKKGKSGGEVGTNDSAEFRGYINLVLTDSEKAEWSSWSQTAAVWDALDAQVALGVNVAVRREKRGESFLASATQRDGSSVNAGLCVTARGRSAGVALTRVIFCLGILGRAEKWEDTQPIADPDRW